MSQERITPPHYNDLSAVHQAAEELLARGRDDPAHPFRKPVMATAGANGAPRARIIILRDVMFGERIVRLHTDARSSKMSEIAENPDVILNFYDPEREVQLQLSGRASIHRDDGFADSAWAQASRPSRRAYLASGHPGTASSVPTSGLPADVEGVIPPEKRLLEGRKNFAAIQIVYHQIDWLFLSPNGNRRARFVFEEGGWAATWLVP